MREVLRAIAAARASGKPAIFCSVVETRGSTPQKPGAVMAVFRDGTQVGTLGGGCTEAEARQAALTMFDDATPRLLVYTLDDDYGWDDGLICGGRMSFCAQPVLSEEVTHYFDRVVALVDAGSGCTEAVVLDAAKTGLPVGARFLFDASGNPVAQLWSDGVPERVVTGLEPLDQRPRPHASGGIAYLPVLPRCRLVLVGAGHVGQAVANLAHELDFDVWVIDDREKFANARRFPHAERILVGDIGRTVKDLETDANTYALIMTRGHSHDEEALLHMAPKPTRYTGLIGSKRKIKLILDDLLRAGIPWERLERVYAPLGVDIGSQTVPEIAVSIVAQLVGHRNRGAEAFPPPAHERRGAAASSASS